MAQHSITRRRFFKGAVLSGALLTVGALTACGAPSAPAPTAVPAKPAEAKPTDGGKPAPPAAPAAPQTAPATKGEARGTVTIVQGPGLRPMDPTVEIPSTTNTVLNMYDPLLWKGDDLKLRPHLAESWKIEDNGLRLRLNLRQGVKFHNGDPLTAEDVKFSLGRAQDPAVKSFHTKYLGAVKEIKVVDAQTVDLLLKEYDNTLPGRLSLIGIASEKVVKEYGDEKFAQTPVGTGPFRFKEWVKGQYLSMEANPDYWGTPPRIGTLIWKTVAEPTTRAAEIQAGKADLVLSVPPTLAPAVDASGQAKVEFVRSLRNAWVVMNAYKKPFDDVRVRRALNYAANVDLYIKAILDGKAYRTAGIWGPQVSGFNPDVKPYDYDPEQAKQLLGEAGYKDGFEVRLAYVNDNSTLSLPELIQALAGDLAKVGVKIKLDPIEANTNISKYVTVFNQDAEMWTHSNANNTAEADYNLTTNVYSKGRGPERTGFYWPTPKDVDDAILKGRTLLDEKEANTLYQGLYKRIVEEAPFIFLYDQSDSYAIGKRLQGWKPRADEIVTMRDAAVAG